MLEKYLSPGCTLCNGKWGNVISRDQWGLCLPCTDDWSKAIPKYALFSCQNMALFMPAVALQNGNWAYFSPSPRGLPRTRELPSSYVIQTRVSSLILEAKQWHSMTGHQRLGLGGQGLFGLWAVGCGLHMQQYPLFHVLSWSWVSLLLGRTIMSCESDWWHKLEIWPVVLFNKRLRTFPPSTQESFQGLQGQYC